MKTDKRVPDDYEEIGDTIMSNFDHRIERDIETMIKDKPIAADYSGWSFHGTVWFDGKWNCEVWCYQSYQTTYSCDDLETLMEEVCEDYGNE